ncbi:metal ABC transporter solute-binding protein, Zn/Mn family [Jeotgalibacillus soli]|uniref:Adhesin n=1 Tax=Jeotgalibacillus soli TaxID=889306 RepID=A0A0C2VHH7_9BACL|nr:zinc ABC transporter substrate-binding protein [Jeotgalibacillus soli]KIL43946.1 adhesin [Jeotgalibacillus soli]
MKKSVYLMLISCFAWMLAACSTNDTADTEESSGDRLDVYTTVYPLEEFTKKIGGEFVHVSTIYPPGADEHTFEPSQQDMIKLAEADLFLYIGLGLEGFVEKATDVLESQDLVMVATADSITDEQLAEDAHDEHSDEEHAEDAHDEHSDEEHAEGAHDEHSDEELAEDAHDEHSDEELAEGAHDEHSDEEHAEGAHDEHSDEELAEGAHDEHTEEEHSGEEGHEGHDHGDVDPHVWLDPVLSQSLAKSIKDSLVEQMPEQEEYFTQNYEALVEQLDELDHKFQEVVKHAKINQMFVSHAAYGYWENRYGIEQMAIAGISTSDEPSQRELSALIEQARENNIQHVIFEQNVSSNITEVIQNEIGADALQLHNLSVLTQEDIDNEDDYFSIMERNTETLKTALQAE